MTITGDTVRSINWDPASEAEEIVQNIRTLLSTHIFSVPLDRRLGIVWDAVDEPLDSSVEGQLREDIFDAIQKYEPRVEINSIDFKYDSDNQRVIPAVDVSIKRSGNE
jgi:phage baseplate assembly protein W